MTSSNPTLLSSPKIEDKLKIEEEDIYDEDDDGMACIKKIKIQITKHFEK